jgi:hypothetical protein
MCVYFGRAYKRRASGSFYTVIHSSSVDWLFPLYPLSSEELLIDVVWAVGALMPVGGLVNDVAF